MLISKGVLLLRFIGKDIIGVYGNPLFMYFRPESSNDVRNHPISEKYSSLKDYLDSTGN